MMKSLGLVLLAPTALLAGCVPLEQAPLVYASRVQMGVGVSGGTSEAPGLDISIGYKQVDAAFVPVAVAKPCPPSIDCSKVDYNLDIVKGTNNQSGQSASDDATIRTAEADLNAASGRMVLASQKITAANAVIADAATLADKKLELEQLKARAAAPPAPAVAPGAVAPAAAATPLSDLEIARKDELETEVARLSRLPVASAKAAKTAQEKALARAAKDEDEARKELAKARDRMRRNSNDDKTDAYSVYGSFNGNASAQRDGAGLALGKVFSTGVAAQTVSQGIRNSAPVDAMARCFAAASKLVGSSTDSAVLLMAISKCQPPEPSSN